MLRDFVYTLDPALIGKTLKQFELDFPEQWTRVALVEFKIVSPDSFLWRFLIDDTVYYLYAEDFVEGLSGVKKKVKELISVTPAPALEFIPVKQPKTFKQSGPFTVATTYRTPENVHEMMKFAVDAGHDFAFLLKSDEDADEAFFND